MWKKIQDERNIAELMTQVDYFHDSCIKEIHYVSGAYILENLSMYPVNDKRALSVLFQQQSAKSSMFELVFEGLKYLKLLPNDENYTCEILDATMFLKDDCIYWCDCGGLTEENIENYNGTLLCATGLRWRFVDFSMGQKEFYASTT